MLEDSQEGVSVDPGGQVLEISERASTEAESGLFRREALEHLRRAEETRDLVRVSPPWTWALLTAVLVAVGVALVGSFVGQVEVNGRGRGILRPSQGVRRLVGQLAGTVSAVETRSGQAVKAGQVLLRIHSPAVESQLLEAERQLAAVKTTFESVGAKRERHHAEQVRRLRARVDNLRAQTALQRASVAFRERRLDSDRGLGAKGLLAPLAVEEEHEALAQAQRSLMATELAIEQTEQELSSLEDRRQEELWQREQTLSRAQVARDTLLYKLQQTAVQAPEDGLVEAMLVKPGDVIEVGQVLGKLVPKGSPLQVVSFLAERDRAFVAEGDMVHLELDQLPYAEYGTLRARVVRVSDDLASPFEVREALGDDQKLDAPTYRVTLEITDRSAAEAARVTLRTGALMDVRYTLRRQRLITLVLDPLRRWLR